MRVMVWKMDQSQKFQLKSKTAISAIVLAIQMIIKYCKKLKYLRKIVLVTDGRGSMDAEDVSEITKKMKEDSMELVVMFVNVRSAVYWS